VTADVLKSKGKVVIHYTVSDINSLSSLCLWRLLQVIHKPLHCASIDACSKTAWKLIQLKNNPIFSWWSYFLAGSAPWSCSLCN